MNDYEFSKADWKLFRQKLPGWQEHFMEHLLEEYRQIIDGEGNASDKFWELEKRTHNDKRLHGVCLNVRKSWFDSDTAILMQEGAITEADLDGFSKDFQDRVMYLYRGYKEDFGEVEDEPMDEG